VILSIGACIEASLHYTCLIMYVCACTCVCMSVCSLCIFVCIYAHERFARCAYVSINTHSDLAPSFFWISIFGRRVRPLCVVLVCNFFQMDFELIALIPFLTLSLYLSLKFACPHEKWRTRSNNSTGESNHPRSTARMRYSKAKNIPMKPDILSRIENRCGTKNISLESRCHETWVRIFPTIHYLISTRLSSIVRRCNWRTNAIQLKENRGKFAIWGRAYTTLMRLRSRWRIGRDENPPTQSTRSDRDIYPWTRRIVDKRLIHCDPIHSSRNRISRTNLVHRALTIICEKRNVRSRRR